MFWGVLSSYIPHKNELWLVTGRVFMLGAGSLFAVFGSQMVGYSGAGPLASIVAAFVACCGWKLEGWTSSFVRVLVCFLVTLGGTLNIKEKFFVAIAWFPKATVQAALGPVALDIARKQSMSDEIQTLASQVLTISVLSILVTAPLGAMAISLTGPRLLNKGASPSALIE
uniref:Uncharacterized protein n=1 Tax=Timema genevievae TaxID=629358 RepID=A0A7R9PLR2_TIMGE|nr:unnamed protein product [Timema genevievae]